MFTFTRFHDARRLACIALAGLGASRATALAQAEIETHADASLAPAAQRLVPRLMPLGDSITQGGQGFASWRYPLWFALSSAHAVDFVGSRSIVFNGDGPGNPNTLVYTNYYTSFDRDHEGWWGIRTDQVDALAYSAALAAQPDLVLVHLGTNDIGQYGPLGLNNALFYLPRILAHIRAARPAVRIFVAQLIPIGPGTGYFDYAPLVDVFNVELAAIVQAESSPASPVYLVDQNTGFDVASHLQSDGLHPNVAGEIRMANVWSAALLANWIAPPPPTRRSVTLADGGFELPLLALDGQSLEAPTSTAWHFGATVGAARGIYNPGASSYAGAAGLGTPQGAEGAQVLYLSDDVGRNAAAVAFQTLATTLENGLTYTLRVAVGRRLRGNPSGTVYGGFKIELLAGNDVIALATDTFVPAAGTFQDATLSCGPDVPAKWRGRALTVRFTTTSTAPHSATDFDDVRLTAQ